MTWVNIPNGDVAAGAPLSTALMTALRDNVLAFADQSAGAPVSSIAYDVQVFSASGTWTKPATALATDHARVWIIGAGGSGAVDDNQDAQAEPYSTRGGGGGAGAVYDFLMSDLSATEEVTIGAGGAAVTGSVATFGNDGGDSFFRASGSVNRLTANGGGKGFANSSTALTSDVDIEIGGGSTSLALSDGGTAGDGNGNLEVSSVYGGGAGGGAREAGASTSEINPSASLFGGNGGPLPDLVGGTGNDGEFPGGGGSASVSTTNNGPITSGAGADGYCVVACFRAEGAMP